MPRKIEVTTAKDPYRWTHDRVRSVKGNAKQHPCTEPGCFKQATDWALLPHAECTGDLHFVARPHHNSRGAWISTATEDYVSLCRAHHRAQDAAARRYEAVA